ncbi:MAG: undecaprenyl/decaprenyl-phosphate alpha-N-acetylglucosaminyl 1-phosphate transferase [Saprospiraceae bacterium]|nr:undecaprenyl/decaprenyl-phosphate alpha-N-acetylglucosaminyl 1-phosphate transferase [Saprospiraceae bacterium]MCF8250705.1 undecaprenyl/decaprenyl-phosphate alpha-N-acetylglucosaminyl 1-phosphate transferase [Saprospiraceae bacterium]MCF8279761.1 undecaprenyl/decaprenyl-phosphate alpha-N-acetylglucosaminyl 1-phosphate transferase [Bacteroidales bacterium]MCF8310533.1 undecaprenyl/decaprenyl-phosphate alpha-N-acetylglucosaminyl 1-phosphate transferase [Saprospiraceae bacterium]MCF8440835.1 u
MELSTTITSFAVAFGLALAAMALTIKISKQLNIIEPNNDRKTHTEKVSSFGGVGIFAAFFGAVLLVMQPGLGSPVMVFALAIPLFAISLVDDLFHIGVTIRFVVQALMGLALHEMGFQIHLFGDIWLLNLGATTFFIMLMINAFNLIDGINGLAGGFGLIGSFVFGILLANHGAYELAFACFAYAGAILGFLGFNFGKKARIFMGDNGSTVLGFFMSVMVLGIFKAEGTSASIFSSNSWLVVLAVVCVPMVDVFKVMSFRLANFNSPFSADRTHIHHLFTDGLLTHPMACAILHGWTLLLVGLAMVFPWVFTLPTIVIAAMGPYILGYSLRVVGKALASSGLDKTADGVDASQ